MSRNVWKRPFGHVRPAKIQISLRIRAVWSESSLGAFWIAKDAVSSRGQRRLWSDCAHAQADLNLRWAHMSEGTFSHIRALRYNFDPVTCSFNNISKMSMFDIKYLRTV